MADTPSSLNMADVMSTLQSGMGSLVEAMRLVPMRAWAKLLAWVLGFAVFKSAEFGGVYFVVSVMVYLCRTLGEKKEGQISAYSVFNKDGYAMPGSLNAEQFENEIRHKTPAAGKRREEYRADDGGGTFRAHFKRKSKAANKPCVCGSGRKYKKCCLGLDQEGAVNEEYEQWKEDWGVEPQGS